MTDSKRPLSPHLQIYKPQLTSILSISHRITGVILSGFSVMIPITLYFIISGENIFKDFKLILSHHFFKLFFIFIIFVLSYHFTNGIRHLLWDLGFGLEIKESYLSGYLVIILSLLFTVISMFLFQLQVGF